MVGQIQHIYTDVVADGTATSVVRPSDWNSVHNQTITLGGNTAGASSISGSGIVLAGGNNVTLSADTLHGSIVISGAAGGGAGFTAGVSTGGNTAGNTSMVASTLVFAGGNNITLSEATAAGGAATITISGPNTVAQTNQTEGFYAVGNTTGQSSSTTLDARTHSFDGAGIVSVGYSGGSIIISATDAAQSNQTDGIYASGNTTGNSSSLTHDARSLTIEFAGIVSGGWSTNNSHLLISATTAAQTNQTVGAYAVGNTTGQSSSSSVDARSISFDGAGIVSVGMSGGSVVISASDAAQTNQTVGVYGVGNTTGQSSSSTVDARSLSFDGAGAISVGMSGGSVVISAAAGGQSVQTIGLYGVGNTTGQSSSTTLDARTLSFDGAGNVSVGYSAGSIVISGSDAAQTNQTVGLYGVGNTTGQSSSSTVDARSLSFDGAGIASVGMSGGSVIISVPSAAAAAQTWGASGNTTAQSSSTTLNNITISAAGIISAGFSAGTLVLSATDAAQTNQTAGLYAVGNTTGQSSSTTMDARTISFDGAGNVSVGYSAGSLIISGSDAAQTNQTLGLYGVGNTTGQSSSTTADARTLSFDGAGNVSVGYSAGSIVISGSDAAQTNQTLGLYGVGNTTGQSSSSTVDARSLSFDGAGIASVGMSGGSVVISVPSGGGAGFSAGVSNIGNTSGNTKTVSNQLVLAGGNNVTLSQSTDANGATVSVSAFNQSNQTEGFYAVGNTTGQSSSTTLDARTHSVDGAGGISVGYSGGSLVISGGQISQATFGARVPMLSLAHTNLANGIFFFGALDIPGAMTVSRLNLLASLGLFGSSLGASTSSTQSTTFSAGTSINAVLLSHGLGNSSSAIYTMMSTQLTLSVGQTISESSNSFSGSIQFGFPTGLSNTSSFSTGQTSTSRTTNNSANQSASLGAQDLASLFNGIRELFFPFGTTLSGGNYIVGIEQLTSGQNFGNSLSVLMGNMGTDIQSNSGYMGAASVQSVAIQGIGCGRLSVSTNAVPVSFALSDIALTDNRQIYGQVMNFGT